jgi:dTDP-glucose 4,6-dehydratase
MLRQARRGRVRHRRPMAGCDSMGRMRPLRTGGVGGARQQDGAALWPSAAPTATMAPSQTRRGGQPMRTLITGGGGFIGSHLCERFLAEGHEVVAVDNYITGRPENIQHLFDNPRCRFIKHDVSQPITIDGPLDNILHFASPASPVDYLNFPIQTLKVGSLGTHHTLGLARAKNARYLLASTSEVYGDPEQHPQREDYWGNVNPVGLRGCYDEAKRFSEAIVMAYYRTHNVNTHIVRIFNTYGERMRLDDGRVLPNFMGQALRGEPLTIYGNGSQTRSFCYVSDLVEGIYRLLFTEFHEPVNLGNPSEVSILEFAREILALSGSKSNPVFKPLPQDDPKVRKPDITRARQLLGWEPKVDRHEGLKRTLDYFRGQVSGSGDS